MSFYIPEEEKTTEGPYSMGEPRRLFSVEVAYTEFMVNMALWRDEEEMLSQLLSTVNSSEEAPGQVNFGVRPLEGLGLAPAALPHSVGALDPTVLGVQS